MDGITKWGNSAPLVHKSFRAVASGAPTGTLMTPSILSSSENSTQPSSHIHLNDRNEDKSRFLSAKLVFSLDSIFQEETRRRDGKKGPVSSKRGGNRKRKRVSAAYRCKSIGSLDTTTHFLRSCAPKGSGGFRGYDASQRPRSREMLKPLTPTLTSSKLCCEQDASGPLHKNVFSCEKISADEISIHSFSLETVSSWESSSPRLSTASLAFDRTGSSSLSSFYTDEAFCTMPQEAHCSSFRSPQPSRSTLGKREARGGAAHICKRSSTEHEGEAMASSLNARLELLRLANPYCSAYSQPQRGPGTSGGNARWASLTSTMPRKDRVNANLKNNPTTLPLDSAVVNPITGILSPSEKDFSIFIDSPVGTKTESLRLAEALETASCSLRTTVTVPASNASKTSTSGNRSQEDLKSTSTGFSESVRLIRSQFRTKRILKQAFRKDFPLSGTRLVRSNHADGRGQGSRKVSDSNLEYPGVMTSSHNMDSSQCAARSVVPGETTHSINERASDIGEWEVVFA